ncbi:hypothetical protein H9P43_003211 [Blastocladiella emersonii ATCC 22665]|nr:hypothetical protein H9P43_003211 [Blastocladiella emersonii ATCC 22665]
MSAASVIHAARENGLRWRRKSAVVNTETVILQLCRSSASGNQLALVAEAIVPLAELPHVGWVPLYDLGRTDGDDLKPVTELWLELEVADPEPEPAVIAPETTAAPAPLAASHEMLGSEISLASVPETRELAPAAGEFSEPSTVETVLPINDPPLSG